MKNLVKDTTLQTIAATTASSPIYCIYSSYLLNKNNYPATTISIQNVFGVNVPIAKTWTSANVNIVANTITITAHGFGTGARGQLTTGGTLPAPLVIATNYFVIVVDVNTIKLATSLVNAQAGTAIDLTTVGTGTSTFTPNNTALAGASVTYEVSNDLANWSAYQPATTITADGQSWFFATLPSFGYLRWTYALTAGQLLSTTNIIINGEG